MNAIEALKKIASGSTTDPAATAQDALNRIEPASTAVVGKRCEKPECTRMPHDEHTGVLLDGRLVSRSAADSACAHILNRIQTDPDLRYIAGPLTETFELLCAAEAEIAGRPLEEVKAQRSKDLQPEHRRRKPDVVVLRERIEALESQVSR